MADVQVGIEIVTKATEHDGAERLKVPFPKVYHASTITVFFRKLCIFIA